MVVTENFAITIEGIAEALGRMSGSAFSPLGEVRVGEVRKDASSRRVVKLELRIPCDAWEKCNLPNVEYLMHDYLDGRERNYWRVPDGSLRRIALGRLISIESHGHAVKWDSIQTQWDEVQTALSGVLHVSRSLGADDGKLSFIDDETIEATETSQLHWYGGAGFPSADRNHPWLGWPAASFHIPEFELIQSDEEISVNAYLDAHTVREQNAAPLLYTAFLSWFHRDEKEFAIPSEKDADMFRDVLMEEERSWYTKAVAQTSADIRAGRYRKLVLARRMSLSSKVTYDPSSIIPYLVEHYPGSFIFAACHEGKCFLGASPERLVRVRDGVANVDCLAGTASRGDTSDRDAELASLLLSSEKNLREHRVVLEWISDALADCTVEIRHAATPQLLRLANVQHLHTPIEAHLRDGVTMLDVVRRLHPTPAVAGTPRDDVVPLIRQREKMDRGWYAGCVGVLSGNGDGEMCVAIRSALIQGHHAILYAGAGIMGDSEPDAEWDETALKLRPMQEALLASGGRARSGEGEPL